MKSQKYLIIGGFVGGITALVTGVVLYFNCDTPTCPNIFFGGIPHMLLIIWAARRMFTIYFVGGFVVGASLSWIIRKARNRNRMVS